MVVYLVLISSGWAYGAGVSVLTVMIVNYWVVGFLKAVTVDSMFLVSTNLIT